MYRQSMLALANGDVPTASEVADKLVAMSPKWYKAHGLCALLQHCLGNPQLASKHLRKGLSLHPTSDLLIDLEQMLYSAQQPVECRSQTPTWFHGCQNPSDHKRFEEWMERHLPVKTTNPALSAPPPKHDSVSALLQKATQLYVGICCLHSIPDNAVCVCDSVRTIFQLVELMHSSVQSRPFALRQATQLMTALGLNYESMNLQNKSPSKDGESLEVAIFPPKLWLDTQTYTSGEGHCLLETFLQTRNAFLPCLIKKVAEEYSCFPILPSEVTLLQEANLNRKCALLVLKSPEGHISRLNDTECIGLSMGSLCLFMIQTEGQLQETLNYTDAYSANCGSSYTWVYAECDHFTALPRRLRASGATSISLSSKTVLCITREKLRWVLRLFPK